MGAEITISINYRVNIFLVLLGDYKWILKEENKLLILSKLHKVP